jgi:hypothetical protein
VFHFSEVQRPSRQLRPSSIFACDVVESLLKKISNQIAELITPKANFIIKVL